MQGSKEDIGEPYLSKNHLENMGKGKRVGEEEWLKGIKYMVMEEDVTLGGGHTMRYTDQLS